MSRVVNDFDPPSHRISSNGKESIFRPIHYQRAKLIRFSRFALRLASFSTSCKAVMDSWADSPSSRNIQPPAALFPTCDHQLRGPTTRNQTHKPISLLKILGGARANRPRMFLDIHEGLCENVLDLVNSCPESPVSKNGRGIPCRARGHGWQPESGAATWGILYEQFTVRSGSQTPESGPATLSPLG